MLTIGNLPNGNGFTSLSSPSQWWVTDQLASVENQPNATYTYYADLRGYTRWALQATLTGTLAVQVYATVEDVASTSVVAWTDVTNTLFGAATIAASGFYADNAGKTEDATWLKITVVASGGGTDDWTLNINKLWR